MLAHEIGAQLRVLAMQTVPIALSSIVSGHELCFFDASRIPVKRDLFYT